MNTTRVFSRGPAKEIVGPEAKSYLKLYDVIIFKQHTILSTLEQDMIDVTHFR